MMDNRKVTNPTFEKMKTSAYHKEESKRFSFRERKKQISYKENEEDDNDIKSSSVLSDSSISSSYKSELKIKNFKKSQGIKLKKDNLIVRKLTKNEQLNSLFQWENKPNMSDTYNLEGKLIRIKFNEISNILIQHEVKALDCILIDIKEPSQIVS